MFNRCSWMVWRQCKPMVKRTQVVLTQRRFLPVKFIFLPFASGGEASSAAWRTHTAGLTILSPNTERLPVRKEESNKASVTTSWRLFILTLLGIFKNQNIYDSFELLFFHAHVVEQVLFRVRVKLWSFSILNLESYRMNVTNKNPRHRQFQVSMECTANAMNISFLKNSETRDCTVNWNCPDLILVCSHLLVIR